MLSRRVRPLFIAALALALAALASPLRALVEIPGKLTDAEFWNLTEEFSEENGYFRSDNFLSNETGYQLVIPDLLQRVKPGRVYIGVAPEINFTYIVNLKPSMAFVVDIRRGNLHEHLLYKALFEMSSDRVEFLSKLFSRPRPAGITSKNTIDEIFTAFENVQPSDALFAENRKAVLDWLTKKHEFALRSDDPEGIDYVYREAFYRGGPYLNYSFGSGMGGGMNSPTYEQLMLSSDATGQNRSFLASEENFAWIKDFETRNILVPVVGDFGGPKAIRAVGKYIKEHGGTVGAFYLSNVEQYLTNGLWENFCASVAALPLDDGSTYIFSGRGAPGSLYGGGYGYRGGGMGMSRTRPIQAEIKEKNCGVKE